MDKTTTLCISGDSNEEKFSKKPKIVLKEEEYTERIEKIIERDFYPDLPHLQAQSEFLKAKEQNDLVALRRLHIKYGPKRADTSNSLYETPSSFETPEHYSIKQKPTKTDRLSNSEAQKTANEKSADVSLDKFFSKNTSEDNAAFDDILTETEKRERVKNAWLYEAEIEHKQKYDKQVALPSVEEQAAITNDSSSVDNWKYSTRNSLMYIPPGVEETSDELLSNKSQPREIVHTNTRFRAKPFSECVSKSKLQEAMAMQTMLKTGKIGPDGKHIIATPTPRVNGYGFVATPSPAPGVADSPLMTWGEIDGTPFRLDGSDTPIRSGSGPTFKIPAIPERDKIGLELAEHASRAHRSKKRETLKRVAANFATQSPKFGRSSHEIINSLSPAARHLATSKLGIRTNSDKSLRDSYTPSPRRSPRTTPSTRRDTSQRSTSGTCVTTPTLISPKVTPTRTSKQSASVTDNLLKLPIAKPHRMNESSSLTDDLLKLPKRSRATDFF